jgi:hypothetical protein
MLSVDDFFNLDFGNGKERNKTRDGLKMKRNNHLDRYTCVTGQK